MQSSNTPPVLVGHPPSEGQLWRWVTSSLHASMGPWLKMAGTVLAHAALHDQSFPSGEKAWIKMMTGLLHSQVPHNMANYKNWTQQRAAQGKHTLGQQRTVPRWTAGQEISLTFHSWSHSIHVCSGKIAKKLKYTTFTLNLAAGNSWSFWFLKHFYCIYSQFSVKNQRTNRGFLYFPTTTNYCFFKSMWCFACDS